LLARQARFVRLGFGEAMAQNPLLAAEVSSNAVAPKPAKNSLRRASLENDVYEALLTRLISLKIPPGARINVDALAKDIGVSQTPIRAALVRLEAEGLVVKIHLVGYSAAPLPSRRRFEQMYELRVLLEPVAATRAARGWTKVDRAAL